MIPAFRIQTLKGERICCESPFVFSRKEADKRILSARIMEKERSKKKRVGVIFIMSKVKDYSFEELWVKSFRTAQETLKYVLFLKSKNKAKEVNKEFPSVSENWTHKGLPLKRQISNWLRKRA